MSIGDDDVPPSFVQLVDGWPRVPEAWPVLAVEAGVALGTLGLDERTYDALRATGATWSLRIDEHSDFDGWASTYPDGSTQETTFLIPRAPVRVPSSDLVHDRAFSEWVWSTHGALGRLLLWDTGKTWWIVNEPDLEATLLCGSRETLSALLPNDDLLELAREPFADWIPTLTPPGRKAATDIAMRFGLTPPASQ